MVAHMVTCLQAPVLATWWMSLLFVTFMPSLGSGRMTSLPETLPEPVWPEMGQPLTCSPSKAFCISAKVVVKSPMKSCFPRES